MQIPFKRTEGEAAFYGPKIDVKLIDADWPHPGNSTTITV